jgi:hypothetical protein
MQDLFLLPFLPLPPPLLPLIPPPQSVALAVIGEVVRVNVTVDGRVRFSQLGNFIVLFGSKYMKISELRSVYRIEMYEIAEMLEMLTLASVQGTLGTTEFVPYDPSIPTWKEQKRTALKLAAVPDAAPVSIPTPVSAGGRASGVPLLSAVNSDLMVEFEAKLNACVGSEGCLASAFGKIDGVQNIIKTSGMSLKTLIASTLSHKMIITVQGSPGTATIIRSNTVSSA